MKNYLPIFEICLKNGIIKKVTNIQEKSKQIKVCLINSKFDTIDTENNLSQ